MLLGPIEGAPTEEWRRMIDVNVLGLLYCTHAALPIMRARGGGHVVNMSSVGGRVVGRYSGVYSLTKFGVNALSEVLRQECQDANIRVSIIEPGRVESELRTHIRDEVLQAISGGFAGVEPLKAQEIGEAVVWAVTQPPNVVVSEVLIRPSVSPM
jgi:NADP-dependent 3-hydroxy acid dehydrogenase YdfG